MLSGKKGKIIMAIYITGDTHGNNDLNKIYKTQPHLNSDDYMIILGDFGICWDNSYHDRNIKEFRRSLPCQVLFLDGNHENYTLLNSYPVTEKFGGKVHEIDKNIFHLMRGQVYEINGKSFFTMGDAASRDGSDMFMNIIASHVNDYFTHGFGIDYIKLPPYKKARSRIPGKTWWKEEIASPKEIATARKNLAACDNTVDYILTHTPPSLGYAFLGADPKEHPWQGDLIDFLDEIDRTAQFKRRYFGHMHKDFVIDDKHIGLYEYFHTI
jgi:hypothetical protein